MDLDYKSLLEKALADITPLVHNTPVLSSTKINEISDAQIFFKCENFQKTGAFKMRGASNAIVNLTPEQKSKGVVTHSSGNMAQAVSLAAHNLGIAAYIVMPENAPEVKKEAVSAYGGIVTEVESTIEAREAMAKKINQDKGASMIHPSNDLNVIMGQATSAMELLSKHSDLDHVLTPVGGGGLVAGTSLAVNYFSNDCTTIGSEPEVVDDAYRSLQSGKIERNDRIDTIADGLRTHLGDINFPIIQKHVSHIITVTEGEIIQAMRLIWERMKIIIEPSCAVPLAAVLNSKEFFRKKKVGIILSGGNVDLGKLPF